MLAAEQNCFDFETVLCAANIEIFTVLFLF